jgi:transcriptional regulator with PAS, ATPase and Fis domain
MRGERVENLPGMIGRHPAMLDVYHLVRRVAPTDLPILIVGPTGTGKELVARAVHALSSFATGPFVDLNCAALPEALGEAELFGVERGAYTGAVQRRDGLLAAAHRGSLFLDEVCSMPPGLQAKLLRALEHQEFRRLGGREVLHSSFRLIATVSEPLDRLVATGRMRADLGFRLAGAEIVLPALCERRSDVAALVEHFLNGGNGHVGRALTSEAGALLRAHSWPGNVRQLRAVIERLKAIVTVPQIDVQDVRVALGSRTLSAASVKDALEQAGGSVRGAARLLGVPRTTLQRWLDATAPHSLTIVG